MAKTSGQSSPQGRAKKRPGNGRQKLMGAALELAATTRSLASLGLREVARHAGLNPNTFYRHFKDFDDLGVAMFKDLGTELRAGLRERRMRPAAKGFRLSDLSDPAKGLGQPERQAQVKREAEHFILLLFWGAVAARAPRLLTQSGIRFPDI